MASIEIFSGGCPTCRTAEQLVREIACPECSIEVVPIDTPAGHARAADYAVRRAPAVVVDGRVVECCRAEAPSRRALQAAIGTGAA